MAKKVIQVPVDEELLSDLDSLSQKQHKARAELIRQACLSFLQRAKNEELDRVYRQGYMRKPEKPELGETQVAISGEFLSREPW